MSDGKPLFSMAHPMMAEHPMTEEELDQYMQSSWDRNSEIIEINPANFPTSSPLCLLSTRGGDKLSPTFDQKQPE